MPPQRSDGVPLGLLRGGDEAVLRLAVRSGITFGDRGRVTSITARSPSVGIDMEPEASNIIDRIGEAILPCSPAPVRRRRQLSAARRDTSQKPGGYNVEEHRASANRRRRPESLRTGVETSMSAGATWMPPTREKLFCRRGAKYASIGRSRADNDDDRNLSRRICALKVMPCCDRLVCFTRRAARRRRNPSRSASCSRVTGALAQDGAAGPDRRRSREQGDQRRRRHQEHGRRQARDGVRRRALDAGRRHAGSREDAGRRRRGHRRRLRLADLPCRLQAAARYDLPYIVDVGVSDQIVGSRPEEHVPLRPGLRHRHARRRSKIWTSSTRPPASPPRPRCWCTRTACSARASPS